MGGCRRFAQLDDDDDEEDVPIKFKRKPQSQPQQRRRVAADDDEEEEVELEEEEDDEKDLEAMRRAEEEERRDPEGEEEEPREEENTEAVPVAVGDPVKITGKGRKQKKHYASFEYLGDTYELDIIETEGTLYVTGQWFYRPEEAHKKEGGCWVARDTQELFYSFHLDDVLAESVMHKCVVHFIPQHKQIPNRKQHPGFIVQKVYDAVEKKLWNLTDKNYKDNKQQEIDLLVKKTIDRIGQLPDLEPEVTPLENNHLSNKQGLHKKPVNPIDVTREPPVGKSEQFAKADTPGSDKLRNYDILVRYKVLTGYTNRDEWLDKLLEIMPLASKENAGTSACADSAAKSSINGSTAKDVGSAENEKSYEFDVVVEIMVALERSAYEALGTDFGKYNQKLRQLHFNIKSSSKLRRRLMDRELDPPGLLTMSPDELKAGLTSAEKTSEPEESRKLQMTDKRCERCSEKKVGISDIIHAGHRDRYQIKGFRTLFIFVLLVTCVAGDVVPPRYREIPRENCSPPDLVNQLLAHCNDKLESNCCEAVAASLDTDTGNFEGQYEPCFCSVVQELMPLSAFISVDDIVNLYFACNGTESRTEIEATVTFCEGDMREGGVLAPSPSN